jgi:hypothetical protein
LNNETEVVEFYEPKPGQIMFSAAGSPVRATQVDAKALQGKTASQIWALVAPGEAVPERLAQAIARSKAAAAEPPASEPAPAASTDRMPQASGTAPSNEKRVVAPTENPADRLDGPTLLRSGGYCSGQFWTDFATWGTGHAWREALTTDTGFYDRQFDNITEAGWAVCPQGDVSGRGGSFTASLGLNSFLEANQFHVLPNYYRWVTWTAGENCGWDASCGLGNRCTPVNGSLEMDYTSDCVGIYGSSCGDHFDYISFWDRWGSFCETAKGPCPEAGLLGCNCRSDGTCDPGAICVNGTTCLACGNTNQQYSQPCCPGNQCSTGSCQWSPAQGRMSCL